VLLLAAGSYALKAVGPLGVGRRRLPERAIGVLELLSIPLLAALVAVQTLNDDGRLVVDARVPAVGVAAVLVWRRAPFLVVVFAAAATAAVLRLL
jgi:branched-subunit amino acid transport protein